ncbi:hypothetical protein J8F10_25940 [Gemmata sp. G18]|uniref:Uncharacterized protein n=1 Tax=Gemmata palustris TaxID=2822762 RepID=A0ABS5BY84_9BACT|nr:effector-associated domain EAD1-containing protein [Gemmata palustris]MBP3958702.1 hypothetical protein [Gemmata palustris]
MGILTGRQIGLLRDCIAKHFTLEDVIELVRVELNEQLRGMVALEGRNLKSVAFDMIEWLEARERIPDLLRAIRQDRAGVSDVVEFCDDLLLSPGGKKSASGGQQVRGETSEIATKLTRPTKNVDKLPKFDAWLTVSISRPDPAAVAYLMRAWAFHAGDNLGAPLPYTVPEYLLKGQIADCLPTFREATTRLLGHTQFNIELVVPRELRDIDFNSALVDEHPITVRCVHRIARYDLRNRLEERWKHATKNGTIHHVAEPSERAGETIIWLPERSRWEAALKVVNAAIDIAGVIFPTASEATPRRIEEVIAAGVPLLVWPRRGDLRVIRAELTSIFSTTPWVELPSALWARRHSTDSIIWRELVMLFDNPNRIPVDRNPLFRFQSPTGSPK